MQPTTALNNPRPRSPALPVHWHGLSSRLNWWVQMCSKGSGLAPVRKDSLCISLSVSQNPSVWREICGTFQKAPQPVLPVKKDWRLCSLESTDSFFSLTASICTWDPSFIDSSCIPDTIQFAVRHQACFTLAPGKHETSRNILQHVSNVCNVKALSSREHQISRSSVENDSHFLRWSSHLQHLNKVTPSKFNLKHEHSLK